MNSTSKFLLVFAILGWLIVGKVTCSNIVNEGDGDERPVVANARVTIKQIIHENAIECTEQTIGSKTNTYCRGGNVMYKVSFVTTDGFHASMNVDAETFRSISHWQQIVVRRSGNRWRM